MITDTKYTLGRSNWHTYEKGIEKEWLITNGIGGYSNQTVIGANARVHHSYLNVSLNPPSDRYTILSKTNEALIIENKEYDLVSQQYISYIREGYKYLTHFELDFVPTYIYQINDVTIKKTISLEYGKNTVFICYDILNGNKNSIFKITPLFNCKELGTVSEKSDLKFDSYFEKDGLILTPDKYKNIKIYFQISDGEYFDRQLKPTSMANPNYLIEESQIYAIDNTAGFNYADFHYTPYDIELNLKPYEHKKMFIRCSTDNFDNKNGFDVIKQYKTRIIDLIEKSSLDDKFAQRLVWSADNFIVNRKSTGLKTILAGYPWFLDWGRDTMIAFTGITLCTKRFEEAKQILESFSLYLKNGIIPNVFPNKSDEQPYYNTIDASLWYFYCVYKYLEYTGNEEDYNFIKQKIYPCLKQIIDSYINGTDFSIKMDTDYLIKGGSDLDQLTWMDVRVGNWVVTPRHGKPVEVNALWYNALCIMESLSKQFGDNYNIYKDIACEVKKSFNNKFWNETNGCLFDVIEIDKDGVEKKDDRIRPNQIWTVSLPFSLLNKSQEQKIVQVVYEQLYTSYGIRSLSYLDKDYKKQYIGKLIDRDTAYHMGTAWAYISGAFISAYCKVNDYSDKCILNAKQMCEYFYDHMNDGCLNAIAEIFDGDFSNISRGCYNQAWSVGEILRVYTEDILQNIV